MLEQSGGTNEHMAVALGIRPETMTHHAATIDRELHDLDRDEVVARWFRPQS